MSRGWVGMFIAFFRRSCLGFVSLTLFLLVSSQIDLVKISEDYHARRANKSTSVRENFITVRFHFDSRSLTSRF